MEKVYLIEVRIEKQDSNFDRTLLSSTVDSVWDNKEGAEAKLETLLNSFVNNKCGWQVSYSEIVLDGYKEYEVDFAGKIARLILQKQSMNDTDTYYLTGDKYINNKGDIL